jgi:hypothetical protein
MCEQIWDELRTVIKREEEMRVARQRSEEALSNSFVHFTKANQP